jgi:hypothetical protein
MLGNGASLRDAGGAVGVAAIEDDGVATAGVLTEDGAPTGRPPRPTSTSMSLGERFRSEHRIFRTITKNILATCNTFPKRGCGDDTNAAENSEDTQEGTHDETVVVCWVINKCFAVRQCERRTEARK